jgi:DNA helicase II / ATP-dependent DNA helicase PcrA
VSFARVVNVPRRKIGEQTLAAVERAARERGTAALEIAASPQTATGIGAAAAAALRSFHQLISGLREESLKRPLPELLDLVLEGSGYREYVLDGTPDGDERWANVSELAGLAGEYAGAQPPEGLRGFLENVALVSDTDALDGDGGRGGVTLITMHQVKGLEFPVVFITGMEEGLVPHTRALEGGESGIAEERRLTYVGMTRAQQRLYLLHAFRRHLYGSSQLAMASRFLTDVPADVVERPRQKGMPEPLPLRAPGSVRQAVHARAVAANPVQILPPRFAEGMRVSHGRYGAGTVLKSTMTRAGEEVVIRFDEAGVRIFAVGDATLEVLAP